MTTRRTHKRKPVAIDLFCGAGGLTEGLKLAGFRVLGAVDNDPLAVAAFRSNHPSTKVWERDVIEITAAEVMRRLDLRRGELDLLAGCPPCQGFSSVRTLNGSRSVRDSRNNLVQEFGRLVRGLLPKTVMMENVPGLAKDHRLKTLLRELADLGYFHRVEVLNAADYGVPQRRRRMILVAGRYLRKGVPSLGSGSGGRATVRSSIGHLGPPGLSGDPLHDVGESRSETVRALIMRIPKDGGSRIAAGQSWQLECHKNCDGFKDVYGRMAWDQPAPTITGGCVNPSKGRFLHPEQNRSITLREAALLQGFRPDYNFPLDRGKFAAAGLIGNALPPGFVRPHAEALKLYVRGESHSDTRTRRS